MYGNRSMANSFLRHTKTIHFFREDVITQTTLPVKHQLNVNRLETANIAV